MRRRRSVCREEAPTARPRAWAGALRLCALSIALVVLVSCTEESVAARAATEPQCGDPLEVHTGRAYFYDATGAGNCGFDATPDDLMVVALNTTDYAGAFLCGGSLRVTGPKGEVVVRIVDRCGGCPPGDIDLSAQAFAKIGDPSLGSVPVRWQLVASDVKGPIVYHFDAESNQWWTAVQVRNHRYPIASFEYRAADGTYRVVERANYNYFIASPGMGPGPYTFRVKDIYGHTLTDTLIAHTPGGDVRGGAQFPLCPQ